MWDEKINYKEKIIKVLNTYDNEVYQRLYRFLDRDYRAKRFSSKSQYVDGWHSFKSEGTPEHIYHILVEEPMFDDWKIDAGLLYHILTGTAEIKENKDDEIIDKIDSILLGLDNRIYPDISKEVEEAYEYCKDELNELKTSILTNKFY